MSLLDQFRSAIGTVIDQAGSGDAKAAEAKARIEELLKDFGFDGQLDDLLPGDLVIGPGPALPALQPILPEAVLRDIATGIGKAEAGLNGEQLMIVSGTVNAQFAVDVGGVAGAIATVQLQIAPRNI